MSLVKVSEITNKQINYLVAQLEGRVLRDPIAATHLDVEHLAVPFTLYEVNYYLDGDESNHTADVTPIRVTRYGVNHAAGATAPSISFTDHQGRKALGTVENYFLLESEAQLEAKASTVGTLEGVDPCANWEDCMPIVARERMLIKPIARTWVVSTYSLSHFAYGDTLQVAAMRCYINSKLGPEVEFEEGEV